MTSADPRFGRRASLLLPWRCDHPGQRSYASTPHPGKQPHSLGGHCGALGTRTEV